MEKSDNLYVTALGKVRKIPALKKAETGRCYNTCLDEVADIAFCEGSMLERRLPLSEAVFFFVSGKMCNMISSVKKFYRKTDGDDVVLYGFACKHDLLDLKRSWGYFTNNPELKKRTEDELSTLLQDGVYSEVKSMPISQIISLERKPAIEQSSRRPLEYQVQYGPNR
jgi:hypothetical protein